MKHTVTKGGKKVDQIPFTFLKQLAGVDENLSGVAYNPGNNTLIAVRNKPPALFEVSLDGETIRKIDLQGFDDTEGIAYMEGSRFAITEETKHTIVVIDLARAGNVLTHNDAVRTIVVQTPQKVKHNKGLEGVTYDDREKVFYAVQEKNPVQVLKVYTNGTAETIFDQKRYMKTSVQIAKLKCASLQMFDPMKLVGAMHLGKTPPAKPGAGAKGTPSSKVKEMAAKIQAAGSNQAFGKMQAHKMRQCMAKMAHAWRITDAAGIYFRRGGGGVGDRLLVLTQEGKALFAMDTHGRVLSMMPVAGRQPEGVVLLPNGRDMFVVGEPNEIVRYTCTAEHKASQASMQETGFQYLMSEMYRKTANFTGNWGTLYYSLGNEATLEKVEGYLGNATFASVLKDANSTLSHLLPASMQTQAGIATAEAVIVLLGACVACCVANCILKNIWKGYKGLRWVTKRVLGYCGCWKPKGKGAAHTYQHMEEYDDVELGLELGELEGLVEDQ